MPSENVLPTPVDGVAVERSIRLADELIRRADDVADGRTGQREPQVSGAAPTTGPRATDISTDVIAVLLDQAWFNQYQLCVLVPLVSTVQPASETVSDVIALARDVGSADSAAIGAVATLVSLMRDGDEVGISDCLARITKCFTDAELVDAATVLTVALTITIAQVLGLNAMSAQNEMIAAVTKPSGRNRTLVDIDVDHAVAGTRHLRNRSRTNRRRTARARCATVLGGPSSIS